EMIRFNTQYLIAEFLERPRRLCRCYMHMLIHCLFRHPFAKQQYTDAELFDLCADIAAEAILDSIDHTVVYEIPSDFRTSWYRQLKEEIHVLTAEKLYQYFTEHPCDVETELRLKQEFLQDDHSFWERMNKDQKAPDRQQTEQRRQQEQNWKNRAKSTQSLLEGGGREADDTAGSLGWTLAFENDQKTDYREFLRRFATIREEVRIDPDGFDYAYYNYGMTLYGNMPLIEENEYREVSGIDELVIAIDTSGSTRASLVQRFLNETAAILSAQETFFHRVHVHLIECDDQVQSDLLLEDVRELKRYADAFDVQGGMGTDFRPVFQYIRELQRAGELQHLRGLLYFTDGFGTYPEEPTAYDTAFVFWMDEAYNDSEVPDWVIKLYAGSGTPTVHEKT
ncbi:MAG: metallopeptidase, partial [Eubacterium sp.]|nr:metallopeptidase [Eubacterium sp.]